MPNRQVKAFDSQLHRLFSDRTHWVKSLIRVRKPGRAPTFNRAKVGTGISILRENATEALLKSNIVPKFPDLYTIKKSWHPKKNKGWGIDEKISRFREWYDTAIGYENCVYIFWAERKCLYVGRTLGGKGRPSAHFSKFWFAKVTRIDVLGLRKKRHVPQLECLATHKYRPSRSRITPSAQKWFSKCPICVIHQYIRDEMRQIFRIA